jgi:threonylcarbamoyladenosine tRNA methylthiotransferase MtaB
MEGKSVISNFTYNTTILMLILHSIYFTLVQKLTSFLDRSDSAYYNATGGRLTIEVGLKSTKTKTTVAVETLGCKLNQAESERLARQLAGMGCQITASVGEADLYILNTCTVTHTADRKARHFLRAAHRENPQARIIALGCYAERAADELARIEGVEIVAGNQAKLTLPQLLAAKGILDSGMKSKPILNRTRSFIKAQEGCDHFCSYCVVPLVRGRERNSAPELVINEVKSRVIDGYREIVLTGSEIGRYNAGGLDLAGLVERILNSTGIQRLRLSSLQPHEITPELIRLWQNPRLCRHFHLSLQSGSNTVLQRMNRQYTARGFLQAVSLIRSEIEDAAITTDVIVGFPGETEAEFRESYDFCLEIGFSRIHVFSYSARGGTAAAKMKDQVGSSLKKLRSEKMLELAKSSLQNFCRPFLAKTEAVLVEGSAHGLSSGLTDNYIRVYTRSESALINNLVPVRLSGLYKDGVWGEIVQDK